MEQIMERIMAIFRADFEKMKADREGRTTEEKTYREKLMTIFGANQEETMACQEKTEARLEGEVPKEDAEVMPVGERRNWRTVEGPTPSEA
jgi:hypothetical protein